MRNLIVHHELQQSGVTVDAISAIDKIAVEQKRNGNKQ